MYKLVVLGKDDKIHCCNVGDKKVSCCEEKIPVQQVCPDFYKLGSVIWCYECSHLLDQQEEHFEFLEG